MIVRNLDIRSGVIRSRRIVNCFKVVFEERVKVDSITDTDLEVVSDRNNLETVNIGLGRNYCDRKRDFKENYLTQGIDINSTVVPDIDPIDGERSVY